MAARHFNALERRQFDLRQSVYRDGEMIRNGDWHGAEFIGSLDQLKQTYDMATQELNELTEILEWYDKQTGRLDISLNVLLLFLGVLAAATIVLLRM